MQFLQATLNFRKFFTPWDMMYAYCLMTFTCVGVYLCNKWIHGGIRGLISIQTGDTVNIFVSKEFPSCKIISLNEWLYQTVSFRSFYLELICILTKIYLPIQNNYVICTKMSREMKVIHIKKKKKKLRLMYWCWFVLILLI